MEVYLPHFLLIESTDVQNKETEREREAETQAEGEAGSMQGTRCGTRSWGSRITPQAEGSTKPLSHRGCPRTDF